MATTIGILVERLDRIINGGVINSNRRVGEPEIKAAICSVGATLLKADYFSTQVELDGETVPEGSMIVTYEGIALTRGRDCATATLPATPMNLPERMGVFSIYPSGRPEDEFYPLQPGLYNLWKEDKMLSPLDNGWYTWNGLSVTIHKDLVGAGYRTVDMKLCVSDFSRLQDTDILPLPGDLETQLIGLVKAMFMDEPKTERKEGLRATPEA